MAQMVGSFFWERLYQWGMHRVFGYHMPEPRYREGSPERGASRTTELIA